MGPMAIYDEYFTLANSLLGNFGLKELTLEAKFAACLLKTIYF